MELAECREIWQLLSNNDKWSYGFQKKPIKIKSWGQLGWLAREDKIEFEQYQLYVCVNVYITNKN